jgi:hypothetical protein
LEVNRRMDALFIIAAMVTIATPATVSAKAGRPTTVSATTGILARATPHLQSKKASNSREDDN